MLNTNPLCSGILHNVNTLHRLLKQAIPSQTYSRTSHRLLKPTRALLEESSRPTHAPISRHRLLKQAIPCQTYSGTG